MGRADRNLEPPAAMRVVIPSRCPGWLLAQGRLRDDTLVERLIQRDNAGGAEVSLRALTGSFGHIAQAHRIGEEIYGGGCHGAGVAYRKELAVAAVLNHLRDAPAACGDGRDAASHG